MAEVKSSAAAFGNLMSLTLIFWMTHSVRAEPGVRAEWNALSRHIHRLALFPPPGMASGEFPVQLINRNELRLPGLLGQTCQHDHAACLQDTFSADRLPLALRLLRSVATATRIERNAATDVRQPLPGQHLVLCLLQRCSQLLCMEQQHTGPCMQFLPAKLLQHP